MTRGTHSLTGIPMRWLRKQSRSREVRQQGAPRTARLLSTPPRRPTSGVFSSILYGAFKPILHKHFSEWPTGRPAWKTRFAYAGSPAKQRHGRNMPDTAHNPNEPGRIRILLPVVFFSAPYADGDFQPKTSRVFCARHGPRRHAGGIHRGAPRGSSAPPVRSTRAPRGCEGESARAREHLFRARRGRVSARRRRRPRLARRRRVRRRRVRRLGPKSNPRPGVCAGTTGRWSFVSPTCTSHRELGWTNQPRT